MARSLKNRRVSLTGSSVPVNREEIAQTDIAVESENARLDTLGPFRQDNVPISQAGVALTYAATDAAAPTSKVVPRGGTFVGLTWSLTAAITAGVATIQPTINGTAVGPATSLVSPATTRNTIDFAAPVAFLENARIGVKITTDANILPAGSVKLYVEPTIRWDP